jgi:hypothetical protein
MYKNLKMISMIAILGASLAVSGFLVQDASASANKSVYSTQEYTSVFESDGEALLASTIIKTSKPQDLLILYDEECSLYTEVNLKSNKQKTGDPGVEIDTARAAQLIQLYVDGTAVGEAITMCDRTYGVETNILNQIQDLCVAVDTLNGEVFEDGSFVCDETFYNSWIATKSAHGWSWVVLDLGDYGDSMHIIEVMGTYVDEDDTDNEANEDEAVVVGQRSLIVIPTHLDVGS